MKIVRLRHGARLVDGDDVISEIRARPGATDTFFDILAAAAATLIPGRRLLILGFAGGGVIAPLRALDYDAPVDAVDLHRDGQGLFRELCGAWAGPVHLHHAEAGAWLRRHRRHFDLILEDIAVPGPSGMTKPPVSLDVLPRLMHQRLGDRGVAVTNLLPVPGMSWLELTERLCLPWRRAVLLRSEEYENRLLIAGNLTGTTTAISRRIRATLRSIGSLQSDRFALQTLK